MVLHRWEYDSFLECYVCLPPPMGKGSGDRCPGCGALVSEGSLKEFIGNHPSPSTCVSAALNWLAAEESRTQTHLIVERAFADDKRNVALDFAEQYGVDANSLMGAETLEQMEIMAFDSALQHEERKTHGWRKFLRLLGV